jgi:colicin import membrane protein
MENTRPDSFKTYLSISAVTHALLIAVFTFKMAFFPSDDLIIQSAIRVDMVALPDKVEPSDSKSETTQETKTPPVEEKKLEVQPETQVVKKIEPIIQPKDINKTKNLQEKALNRLQAMSALEKLKEQVEKVEPKKNPSENQMDSAFKGNVVTKGSDLKGLSKLQYDDYFSKLEKHIKANWILPQWLADSDLKTQVRALIDERGFVVSKEIVTSSGNSVFDNMAISALEKASPCPVAPDSLKALVANEGIVFNFP